MVDDVPPVGIIAGSGRTPILVANGIRRAGRSVVLVALRGLASRRLIDLADAFVWSGVTRLGKWISFFRAHGVREVVLIGGVRKSEMYRPLRVLRYIPDWRTPWLWYATLRKDKRDNAVLSAVADELRTEGIELVGSVKYCTEHLADEGLMTKTPVPGSVAEDVEFGWRIARASADLDVGQSVAVKERDIIAVEAMEGTDAMIRRVEQLCHAGRWTMIKVARPNQDVRFDVPTVGPHTIRNLKEARCACLVLEAGMTLIVDKPATLALADKLKIPVVGKREPQAGISPQNV
ncbi:MAG: LpxI family protein [Planctomycetota bacterium]|jgi:DUF1009 family protein